MAEEVVGFTDKQRQWFLERDGHRCQFHYFAGRWIRCAAKTNLQVHHIIPRGWSRRHLPPSFQVNGSLNGITLCEKHHVSQGSVHPDTFKANQEYRRGDKQSYVNMMERRRDFNNRGEPYWCTKWDWMFNRIARKQTGRYSRIKPYPTNGNRGNNGRVNTKRR